MNEAILSLQGSVSDQDSLEYKYVVIWFVYLSDFLKLFMNIFNMTFQIAFVYSLEDTNLTIVSLFVYIVECLHMIVYSWLLHGFVAFCTCNIFNFLMYVLHMPKQTVLICGLVTANITWKSFKEVYWLYMFCYPGFCWSRKFTNATLIFLTFMCRFNMETKTWF